MIFNYDIHSAPMTLWLADRKGILMTKRKLLIVRVGYITLEKNCLYFNLLVDSLSGCPIAAMGKISAVQIKKALSSGAPGSLSASVNEFFWKL